MLKGASPLCGMMTIAMFPILNSILLLGLAGVMGGSPLVLVGVVGFGIVSAIVTSALVQASLKGETPAETGGFDEEMLPGFGGFCHGAVTEFVEYGKYLAVGAFLAVLVAVFVPNRGLISWVKNTGPTETASAMLKGFLSPVTYFSLPAMTGYLQTIYSTWPPLSAFVIVCAGFNVVHFSVVYGALKGRAAGLYLAVMALCVFIFTWVASVWAMGGAK